MNPIRARIAAVFLLGLILGAAAGSWGQRAHMLREMRRGPDPKRMLDRLGRQLSLDDAQKAAVGATFEAHKADVEAARAETFAKLEKIRIATDADLRKILTPAQFARFESTRRARRMRIHWEAPPPPPQP